MKLAKIKQLVISHWPLAILFLVTGVFFWKFLFKGLMPIPADTIVGMYHPWRDKIWDNFSAGVPFKNFLITDPVRQQYPWRQLVIELLKKRQLPWWNPYTFAGTPLLANFQSGTFYFLNSMFYVLSSSLAWGILIFLQPLLAGIFTYWYLREMKLNQLACLLGALSFSFSGFFIAWMEWGTVLHSALWLPLILLSIEKIFIYSKNLLISNIKYQISNIFWGFIYVFALTQSFFAGHLQIFFYVFIFSSIYLIWKLSRFVGDKKRLIFVFVLCSVFFVLCSSIQWQPTLEFIRISAREADQADWQQPGWFIPWRHLVQMLAPDFFGNPATLNYWGEWNYGEFMGYLGVIPLIFALYAIFFVRTKYTILYTLYFILFLSFALPTPWAKLPFLLKLPFVSTSQPTRMIFVVDFCLAILAAFGAQKVLERKPKIWPILGLLIAYGILWLVVLNKQMLISQRNLILPTGMFLAGAVFIGLTQIKKIPAKLILAAIIVLTAFDLLRCGWKFNPFVKKDWLFPSAQTIDTLKKDNKIYRVMATDRRIFPPNFSIVYKIQTLEGYDPLYSQRYAELIAALERGKPDIKPPFGFNRIITPQNYQSRLIDLLNVKYVLSLTDLDSSKLALVNKEGETRLYYNKEFFPRAFMVYNYRFAESKQEAITMLMDEKINLKQKVILEENLPADIFKLTNEKIINSAIIEKYSENDVLIDVRTNKKGFLVLTDSYYPGWQAFIDGKVTKIYQANYNFRMVIVPMGEHKVKFKYAN